MMSLLIKRIEDISRFVHYWNLNIKFNNINYELDLI